MLATVLLLVLMAVVAWTDIARHKIYNWTTYPCMLAEMALNGLGDLLVWCKFAAAEQLAPWGWIGFGPSLFGFLLCGCLLLTCFVFFHIGAGDVKLMAMMGAFLGPQEGLEALLWTFILGGCLGAILLIWRVGAWRPCRWLNTWRTCAMSSSHAGMPRSRQKEGWLAEVDRRPG